MKEKSPRQYLTVLRFEGPRFEDHGLDLDVLQELVLYKKILLETAKELWRQANPDRKRLPTGLEASVSIKFYELQEGSTAIPLVKEIHGESDQPLLPFEFEHDVDRAAGLIEAGIEAAGRDDPLPDDFPKKVLPMFADLGKTLAEDEAIYARARGRKREVRYTARLGNKLSQWVEPSYEDIIELVGEVRAADLDGRYFSLRPSGDRKIQGRFEADQESAIVDALRDHERCRLWIKGWGEFSQKDGSLNKIIRVEELQILPADHTGYVPSLEPIWKVIAKIGEDIPQAEQGKLPEDLSENLDHYLYGAPKSKRRG